MSGKVCIVTGAGSGIGRATAIRLAEEGGKVLCADLSADGAAGTARQIEAAGGEALDRVADVADSAAVGAMVAAAVDRWGGVDVLVNNAGVNIPGLLHEVSDEVIDRTLDVNVKGQLYGCRAVIPVMLERGGGSIVNIASVNGIVSEPFLTVYSASKGASVMLTKGVALDYARQGIRCNVVCPGWVDTPINYAHAELLGGLQHVYDTIGSFQPIGRPGEPREIANVVLFLASDEASFMTGSVVSADGGMTAQ
ncbi:MAG: SDR family NAD(P)-dependent oxidoreductase [Gemmatimonadota bacterium]